MVVVKTKTKIDVLITKADAMKEIRKLESLGHRIIDWEIIDYWAYDKLIIEYEVNYSG